MMRQRCGQVSRHQRSHEVGGGSTDGRKPDDLRGMEQGCEGSRCESSTALVPWPDPCNQNNSSSAHPNA